MSKHIRYIKVQDCFFFLVFLLDQNFHLYSRRQILSAKEYTFPFLFLFWHCCLVLFSFFARCYCLCTHPALLTPEKKKNKVASTSFQLYGGACVCVCVVCWMPRFTWWNKTTLFSSSLHRRKPVTTQRASAIVIWFDHTFLQTPLNSFKLRYTHLYKYSICL